MTDRPACGLEGVEVNGDTNVTRISLAERLRRARVCLFVHDMVTPAENARIERRLRARIVRDRERLGLTPTDSETDDE